MANMTKIPFVTSTGVGFSEKDNSSLLLNLFAHKTQNGSKSEFILMGTEGAEYITEVSDTIYGVFEVKDLLYIATATKLLRIEDDGTFKELGDVEFNSDVTWAWNGLHIMVVAQNGYAYTLSDGTFKDMSIDTDWNDADTVAYMDGYFIFNRTNTGQFFISKLYSTEIDAIDFATGESAPDDTLAVVVSNRQLWLMGERTLEAWYDSGDADFPFTRINGAVRDIGIANHHSVSNVRDKIIFVGDDFKVYAIDGYTPTVISTPVIDKVLDKSDANALRSFTFNNNGHWFYVLHINNEVTFTYDLTTNLWHNRMSVDTERWFIDGAINKLRDNSLFAYADNKLYVLSTDILTEDQNPIRREAITVPLNKGVNMFTLVELQLDAEVAQETDAQITLQTSKDGGVTWSNNNYAKFGATGWNEHRIRWQRLGRFRDCIIKIVITDPITIRLLGLHARVK